MTDREKKFRKILMPKWRYYIYKKLNNIDIKMGNPKKIFYFRYIRKDKKVQMFCFIERTDGPKESHKRWLWTVYSNALYDKIVWGGKKTGKYHFYFSIPNVIILDTDHIGKKIFNSRINLTSLFKKDFKSYSSGDDVMSS